MKAFSLHRRVLAFAALLSSMALAQAPPRPSQRVTGLTPTRAASFLDSLGINAHLTFNGPAFAAYQNTEAAEQAILYLGFHYVRDGGGTLNQAQIAKLAEVANKTKIHYDFALGSGGEINIPGVVENLRALLAAAPGSVASVEGPNEVNNIFHAKAWAVRYKGQSADLCAHRYAPLVAAQHDLFASIHADPQLKELPVYNFSVVPLKLSFAVGGCTTDFEADLADIGDVSASADYINLHGYPFQGAAPGEYMKKALTLPNPVNGRPIAYTETGYSTGESPTASPHLAVSETVQQKYELDAVLDLYRLGVSRTFLYELLDDAPDQPAKEVERHYGLFYADGRPKPSAQAFHNLVSILADPDPRAMDFKPTPMQLAWTQSLETPDQDANQMHVFLEKADGTGDFIVWGEPPLWSLAQLRDLPLAVQNKVTIKLPRRFASINLYDPLVSAKPIVRFADRDEVQMLVRDHPVILEFR